MARVPQDASHDVQISMQEVNAELVELRKSLKKAVDSIPSSKAVEELQGAVVRLSKTPTYLDPNDVFRGSGPAHMHGYVPDPGATPGTDKFLREDGTWQTASGGAPGPHTHSSDEITHVGSGYISADDVKEALEELDSEKLARSGAQDMLGDLDMGGNAIGDVENLTFTGPIGAAIIDQVRTIYMTGQGEIDGVKHLDMSVSAVGEGIIESPRILRMAGDDSDGEALIERVERIRFNDEVTKSVIDLLSRINWNTKVVAGTDYTGLEGRQSWDALEDTLVAWVASGASVVAMAFGWASQIAVNGTSSV